VLAVLLHGQVVVVLLVLHRLFPPAPARVSNEPLDVSLMDENDLSPADRAALGREPSLALAPPEPTPEEAEQKKAEEEQKKQEDSVKPPGQVVEIPQPVEEKVPQQSNYVSEFNSSVEKQTIHRGRPGEPEGAAPRPGERQSRGQPRPPQVAPTPPSPPEKPGGPPTPTRLAMRPNDGRTPGPRGPGSPGEEAEAPDGLQPRTPRVKGGSPDAGGAPQSPSPGGGPRRPLSMADLTPSEDALSRAIGRGGSVDAVRDAEEGETTALNARRWKFASFFNRVKRAVSENWHPDREYRRRDPAGNVYGFKDRLTVVKVELTAGGALKDIHVEHPCGIDFLDDEAVRAFRAAQPFPNPPRQLVGESGLVSFRFGFLFELSSRPVFRVFRYHN
jgi:TonB family protein